ncbi:MAG: hypothetical protein WC369_06775 [Dehalococcoidales bacterium]|jgi:hypothetical protein
MKKLVIITVVLLAGLFFGLTVLASSPQISHRNPSQVPGEVEMDNILKTYAGIFDMVGSKGYRSAQDLFAEMGGMEYSEELRYLVERGTTFSLELTGDMDHLESLLDEASRLIDERQLVMAASRLDEAAGAIVTAQQSLAELEKAVYSVLPESQTGQVYELVTGSLKSLGKRVEQIDKSRRELDEYYQTELLAGLITTDLEIGVWPSSVYWGGIITVSGKLTGGGEYLAWRDVSLFVGTSEQTVTTGADGSYYLEVNAVPVGYSDTLTAMAIYQSAGEDEENYLSSRSQTLVVGVSFLPTQLEVTAPESAFVGQSITLNGHVIPGDLSWYRTIKILWDGDEIEARAVGEEFSIEVTPPSSTPSGEHILEVRALPQERYAGMAQRLPVSIRQGVINAEIEIPAVALVPQLIRISGQVDDGNMPLGSATVNISLGNEKAIVRPAADGSFQATLVAPLDFALVGPQKIDINIIPDEPWLHTYRAEPTIFMLSPVVIFFLALMSVIFMVWLIITARPPVLPAASLLTSTTSGGVIPVPVSVPVPGDSSDERNDVLSSYLSAVEIVTRVSGIAPAPQNTLREYLTVALRLDGGFEAFRELTGLAEQVLYAPRGSEESLVYRSAQLLGDIKRELRE